MTRRDGIPSLWGKEPEKEASLYTDLSYADKATHAETIIKAYHKARDYYHSQHAIAMMRTQTIIHYITLLEHFIDCSTKMFANPQEDMHPAICFRGRCFKSNITLYTAGDENLFERMYALHYLMEEQFKICEENCFVYRRDLQMLNNTMNLATLLIKEYKHCIGEQEE